MTSIMRMLFAAITLTAIQAQTWSGIYQTDSTCNREQCCCMNGRMVVSPLSTSIMTVAADMDGRCGSVNRIEVHTGQPTGYTVFLQMIGTILELRLSSDSRTMTFINPTNVACNFFATKIPL